MSDVMEIPAQTGPSPEQLSELYRNYQVDNFMQQHGSMFGNDRNIGAVILDNLYATQPEMAGAATAEAVQNVLDQLRSETEQMINQAQNILSVIGRQQQQKLDDVANAVATATGAGPDNPVPSAGQAPIESSPTSPAPPPVESVSSAAPPTDVPPPAPIPEASAAPSNPVDAPLPPEAVPSDVKLKDVRKIIAKPAVPTFRSKSHMLGAIKGNWGGR